MSTRYSDKKAIKDDFDFHGLSKGDVVYYARTLPRVGIYEIIELKIRTVENTYFVGTDKDTQHAYLFNYDSIGIEVFTNRIDALKKVNEAEKNKKFESKEKDYEEY